MLNAMPAPDWPPHDPASAAGHLLPRRRCDTGVNGRDAVCYTPVARHDYTVRRAFLQSYRFSVRESLGEQLRRRLRAVGAAGRDAAARAAGRVLDGRWWAGVRVAKALRSGWHGWRLDAFGCLSPRRQQQQQPPYYMHDFI